MFGARRVATLLLVLGALALAAPAMTLAAGGGSAGDQQYTDPFAGSKTTATSAPAPTTTSSPAPATAAPSSSSSSGSSSDTGSTAAPAPAVTTPTATAAGTIQSTTAAGTATTLPYTGYDSWMAGVLGLVMLGAGISLRRRSRRA